MPTILVVDDSAFERHRVGALLRRPPDTPEEAEEPTLNPLFAANGREALTLMEQELPDLVLTDLQMPEMDGLELVEAIRGRYPAVPVILMAAHGSEEIAVRALQRGAASYVPKRNLARDLVETVQSILALTHAAREQQRVLDCLTFSETHFELENDSSLIPALVNHLQDQLRRNRFCDEGTMIRITVALREALMNAIEHGNLEVKSDLKDVDPNAFHRQVNERRNVSPYRERRVLLIAREAREDVTFIVRDQGPGFSPESLPDPTDPEHMERAHGRGLLLIRTFMDDVRHNAAGNEITLVKRRGES